MPDFSYVQVDHLHFDPENPRFPKSLDGQDVNEVLRFMLGDANLIDLMRSIAAQGYFPGEPLLVSPSSDAPGDWIVVEGNRRLAATKLLANPELAPTQIAAVATVAALGQSPREIPCLQFQQREEILVHLGYRHVTGIQEWTPLAKARYLLQRYDEVTGDPDERFRELARTIGSRKDYVGRLLTALEIYKIVERESYYGITGLDEDSLDFSLLSSVLAYQKIVAFLGLQSAQSVTLDRLSVENLRLIITWMFQKNQRGRTILGESRNIRTLAEVVSYPRSLEALIAGESLSFATKLNGAAMESFQVAVGSAREHVGLARNYLDDLEDTISRGDTEAVEGLHDDVMILRTKLAARVTEDA